MSNLDLLVVLIPLLTHGAICWKFRALAEERLNSAQRDTEGHRSLYLVMMGFSFAALSATIAIARDNEPAQRMLPGLFLSFVCYYSAHATQSYKFWRWQDDVSTALYDCASLALLVSLARGVVAIDLHWLLDVSCWLLVSVAWGVDHVIRVQLVWSYRSELKNSDPKNKTNTGGAAQQ